MKRLFVLTVAAILSSVLHAEDGYRLWLRYDKIDDPQLLQQYRTEIANIVFPSSSPTLNAAKQELMRALQSLLDTQPVSRQAITDRSILAGTPATSSTIRQFLSSENIDPGNEGYIIRTATIDKKKIILLAANTDVGVLYGTFAFLRLLQTHQPVSNLSQTSRPRIQHRILNHWDNLNRTVERGYAGASIFNWHLLPDYIDQRYIDYARANASIGINGSVLTNVNANALVLTTDWLKKVKALADAFRPYGIRVYLTARFSAPVETGELETADPLDPKVQNWWKNKCREIYSLIPDFGGFLVKANSEGQPGPQSYGRSHAEGANMFADALSPYGGIVMWRAFVYDTRPQQSHESFEHGRVDATAQGIASADRFRQAYAEFKPLDGQFRKNVLLQVKNGPIDFQPREPFSPLFGAMPQTPVMMEFQVTQEYLGQGTHLVYLAPLYKETLDADTYANGKNSTVADVIDGSLFHQSISGIAGVSNIGNERNWTSHPFGQANWYAYGRLAWDHRLTPVQVAREWIRQAFSNNATVLNTIEKIMLASREAVVNYMTPLGLHHIMAASAHYGPGPWMNTASRPDWNPDYYHRADSNGIGFNRTSTGSAALDQYNAQVKQQWNDPGKCDERFLLWFHHIPWTHRMKSGKSLWDELCMKYQQGVDTARWMRQQWNALKGRVDEERFRQVNMLLAIQVKEAEWWKNACLLYFQSFSRMPLPPAVEKPDHTLQYYQNLKFPLAPGIGGNL